MILLLIFEFRILSLLTSKDFESELFAKSMLGIAGWAGLISACLSY
jgi:hypothetical protein